MLKTKIDWCDSSWNPVTGCLGNCRYCYARKIAERFGTSQDRGGFFEEDEPVADRDGKASAYPHGFSPTLYRYRLDDYLNKKGRNIFVCSMGDMFRKEIPDSWKAEVLEACARAPQHNYIFLTKHPSGYSIWPTEKFPDASLALYTDNMWLGVTFTGKERLVEGNHTDISPFGINTNFWYLWQMSGTILNCNAHRFLNLEPMLCDICAVKDERNGGSLIGNFLKPEHRQKSFFEWVVVGAETGNQKGKTVPEREWLKKLHALCQEAGIPLFMKDSLEGIWEGELVREYPEQLKNKKGEGGEPR